MNWYELMQEEMLCISMQKEIGDNGILSPFVDVHFFYTTLL